MKSKNHFRLFTASLCALSVLILLYLWGPSIRPPQKIDITKLSFLTGSSPHDIEMIPAESEAERLQVLERSKSALIVKPSQAATSAIPFGALTGDTFFIIEDVGTDGHYRLEVVRPENTGLGWGYVLRNSTGHEKFYPCEAAQNDRSALQADVAFVPSGSDNQVDPSGGAISVVVTPVVAGSINGL